MRPTLRAGISLDEYLGINCEQACELIAGELRPKPMGTFEHSGIQGELHYLISQEFGRTRTRVELSVRHGDDVLIPDICVVATATPRLYRGVLDEVPVFCVEIVSPSQRAGELFVKCEMYHEWGVPYCWVVEPVGRRAWCYHAGQSQAEEVFDELYGPMRLSLSQIF